MKRRQDLGEIVHLSHEFAIGLAEHFDTLHRVSEGDLNARVGGTFASGNLESLKTMTNDMIESVSREIAERKLAEEASEHRKENCPTIFNSVKDGIVVLDRSRQDCQSRTRVSLTQQTMKKEI